MNKIRSVDYIIPLIFIISLIVPIQISLSQQYITEYGDDIAWISWTQKHTIFDIFEIDNKLGTGYRPFPHIWYFIVDNFLNGEPFYYYLLNGVLFACSMIFLYLLGKILHSSISGIIAILLYMFLDASFILVSKINFVVTLSEIFFITSALYFSIKYFKNNDKISMWIAIILSVFAFLSKEPSLLIIPFVNLTHLWYSGMWKRNYIVVNLIPFIYMFFIYFFIAPEVGSNNNSDQFQSILSNILFYINNEILTQFKTPILILSVMIVAIFMYFHYNLKKEISVCTVWFIVAISPFLITQQSQQPTYLAEANLGIALLIGIVISESFKKINIISIILIIGILIQMMLVPLQITNMQNHNKIMADKQNTFFEITEELANINQLDKVFYLSDDIRKKYNTYQINEGFFEDYLCIRKMCNIKVTINYSETRYIILPTSQDIEIFRKVYPNEELLILKQISHNNEKGIILMKDT